MEHELDGRRGRRRPLLLLAALAAAALCALPGTAGATNYQKYTAPSGNTGSAPDIIGTVVSNDPAGNLTFEITLANAPDLSNAEIDVLLDSDQNASTGNTGNGAPGLDYAVWAYQGRIVICRWTGSECSPGIPQPANAAYTYANGVLSYTVAPADIGVTGGFNFLVISYAAPQPSEGNIDGAPDFGTWNYQIVAGAPKLAPAKVVVTNANAGKSLVVGMAVARQDSGVLLTSGTVACKATIAGAGAVKGTGGFVKEAAICAFKIPKTAKGKTIKGTITVGFEGATLSKPFSAKIK